MVPMRAQSYYGPIAKTEEEEEEADIRVEWKLCLYIYLAHQLR